MPPASSTQELGPACAAPAAVAPAASSGKGQRSSPTGGPMRYRLFERYAWGVLLYILFVILFGAWVRISGSGAGCGEHWPTCNGELIPRSPQLKTIIEYTHRLTSGLLGPLVLGLLGWTVFGVGRRRVVKWCAGLTLGFVVLEALIGAQLVLKELVASDDSVARAIVIALHLANTLILTGAAALCAFLGAGREAPTRWFSGRRWLAVGGLSMVMVLSMTGAVTALGDTLFPVAPTLGPDLLGHVREDLAPSTHFLVRLRAVHPLLACCGVVGLVWIAQSFRRTESRTVKLLANALMLSALLQLLLGALNIMLGAPGWLQLAHLLVAQGVWIGLVLLWVQPELGEVRKPTVAA